MKTNDVIGLGAALMDFLIEVDEDKLIEFDLKKGEMHLVDEEKAKSVLEKINHHQLKIETIPGGSSANTLKGIALLGGKAILCGKVGDDSHGEVYVQEIEKFGLQSRIKKHNLTTGHAVTFITPDSERTFSVHLGAALELYKEDVLEEDIEKSKILHLEGYQIEGPTKETIMHAIELAKKHNTLVSIDLADPGLIRRNKEFLKDLVMNHADIVFVNEKEAKEFTGLEPEEALNEIAKHTKVAVVKLGKEGSLISSEGMITMIDAHLVEAVDTTGAGDSYAAGFLYGYTNELNIEQSGKLGSLLASKVVAQKGVGLKDINADELKEKVNE
ncbi:adenosine kinase [Candidatus Woesearchaeota archaeon]|jgi:sugar/nucleoside kinase (ribokinase family)|nr:adenosine kinase [Candidatus Woesearchaeota archaeon]MBT4805717.1 adenosine kinase [Candidatus Woesearchaeota archaeon]MBT5342433.1 adenosine kinase [Candidatus Woesearchaeota archaeon]